MRWPDGQNQCESMDLVQEIDKRYGDNTLYPDSVKNDVLTRLESFKISFHLGQDLHHEQRSSLVGVENHFGRVNLNPFYPKLMSYSVHHQRVVHSSAERP